MMCLTPACAWVTWVQSSNYSRQTPWKSSLLLRPGELKLFSRFTRKTFVMLVIEMSSPSERLRVPRANKSFDTDAQLRVAASRACCAPVKSGVNRHPAVGFHGSRLPSKLRPKLIGERLCQACLRNCLGKLENCLRRSELSSPRIFWSHFKISQRPT